MRALLARLVNPPSVSRPRAAERQPLARDPTNCRADLTRRRAFTLGSAAQTMVTVLGTRFGTQNYEIPL